MSIHTYKYALHVIILLLLLSGCAKRGMLVKCTQNDYENFFKVYKPYCEIEHISGNGDIEIVNKNNNMFGKFSIVYSKKENRWAITIYGVFGMVLSEIEIRGDSFSISSSILEKPIKSTIKKFDLEGFTGIPLDAEYIPFLSTGRVCIKSLGPSISCIKRNGNLTEFIIDKGNKKIKFAWNRKDKRMIYFKSDEENMQTSLETTFSNYKNMDGLQLPYTILLSIKGKKEGYLKLTYRFLSVK